jgi:hypothetical protein
MDEFREAVGEEKYFEHTLKGTWEGIWRSIGWRDTKSLRQSADHLRDVLYELAQVIDDIPK